MIIRKTWLPAVLACCILLPLQAQASWRASADSLYALAGLHYEDGDYRTASQIFGDVAVLIASHEAGGDGAYFRRLAARSRFMAGRSYEGGEDWERALDAYAASLPELEDIGDVVRIRMAITAREGGDREIAVEMLREVIDDDQETALDLRAIEELADTYRGSSDWDMALQWYRVLLTKSGSYDVTASAHYQMALTLEKRGDHEAAKAGYAAAVNDYPRSRHSHEAMKRGRRLSRSFTDRYHQGLVLYNRKLYRDAAEFFSYYLRHNDEREFAAEATYFLGRSYQRKRSYGTAAHRFEDAVEFDRDGEYYDLAWLKLAYCRRATGRVEESLATYDEYIELHPDRPEAADAQWEKARLLEDERRWDEAADEYQRLARLYPRSEHVADARFRAGLCLFKRGLLDEAEAAFADIYAGGNGTTTARALYWIGKVRERLLRTDEAVEIYQEAAEADRDSYYGQRSLERLGALDALRRSSPATVPTEDTTRGFASRLWGREADEFGRWVGEWSGRALAPVERMATRQRLMNLPDLVRADHMLALHMRAEAERELALLEREISTDPVALDILATYCERSSLSKRAIRVAERIFAMSPAESLSDAPIYLRKKICPRHFSETVETECVEQDLEPHIVYSLMRQESLFESDAVSWVGARGLTQIMPPTGRWIARRVGHRGFRLSHLLDPETNVHFGVYYLAQQLDDFDGDLLRALAAYNGGPDNVKRWWKYGGISDSDVFVEDIGFSETSDYVRRVYRYYRFYDEIYGVGEE
jgi:soluble lytic murein transglycosylase